MFFLFLFIHPLNAEVQFKVDHHLPPASVCSLPCSLGQAKKYVEGESCCWHCFNCSQYQASINESEIVCRTTSAAALILIYHSFCRSYIHLMKPNASHARWAQYLMTTNSNAMIYLKCICGPNRYGPLARCPLAQQVF